MAFDVWIGPGGPGGKPRGGDFGVASNWSTGAVPDGSVNAVLGSGNYTVSVTRAFQSVASLSVGAGVSLNLTDPDDTPTGIGVSADSINQGMISLQSAGFIIGSGATMLNLGIIRGTAGFQPPRIQGGSIENHGLITTYGEAGAGSLALFSQVTNAARGVISANPGGVIFVQNSLSNDGLVSAVDGGRITFSGLVTPGSATNFADGVLTGGSWLSKGEGSVLDFYGLPLREIGAGAVVTLAGSGSQIQSTDDQGVVTGIEASLDRIGQGGSLVVTDRDYATTLELDVIGRLTVKGGALTADGVLVHGDDGSSLTGYGVVDGGGDMVLYGYVGARKNAAGQTLNLEGGGEIHGLLGGRGTLEFSGGIYTLEEGARVQSKGILISDATLGLSDQLIYDNRLTMAGGELTVSTLLRLKGVTSLGGGAEILSNGGALQFVDADVKIGRGGATIDAELRNDATVELAKGSLVQLGAVKGVGEFTLDARTTLTFGAYVGAGQQITFAGQAAVLDLQDPDSFQGTVAGFTAGQTIHLEGFAVAGGTLSYKADGDGEGGTLKLTNGLDVATLHFDGGYTKSGFQLADDGEGGANLTYAPPAGAPLADAAIGMDADASTFDGWLV